MSPSCIFCDIVHGKVDAKKVFVDDEVVAFHDRSAAAPVHVLVVPKKHITGLSATHGPDGALLGQLLVVANHVARELKLQNSGYRVVINDGVDAGQTVPHLHVHLLGGRALAWPPG